MKFTNTLWAGVLAFTLVSCGGGEAEESTETAECAPTEEAVCEPAEETAECAPAATYGYAVDASASSIEWSGEQKLQGKIHTGTINITEGGLNVEEGAITGGSVTVDMNSIVDTDLTEDQGKGKLEGHLKSPDFFDVAQFPTAKFEITGSEEGTLTGNLTIKEATQEVTVTDVEVTDEEGVITATGNLTFDRSKFDVRYNSGVFYKDLGDNIIADEIGLKITISASAAE